MARKALRIGERGAISTLKLEKGKWRARCFFRDNDGLKKPMSRYGRTKGAAEGRLKDDWLDYSKAIMTGRVAVTNPITVNALFDQWMDEEWKIHSSKGHPAASTLRNRHSLMINHILPRIGEVPVNLLSTGRLNSVLADIPEADGSYMATAVQARAALMAFCQYAVTHELLGANVARETNSIGYQPPEPRPLTAEEIAKLRHLVSRWQMSRGNIRVPVLDVIDFMLGTGCRIGEALGIQWEHVHLNDPVPWVRIEFAVVYKAAVETARLYLSYFTGPRSEFSAADQRRLRHAVGENRKQVYDIRQLIETLADEGSVLELRREFGVGAITALVRIEGQPMGLVANNPMHLGGAIDADAADKMARFLQLCDAHGLPVVSLCDTPGFMVGPEAEKTATVRHFSRLFVIGAHLRVPMITVILRKAYGLGAQAMAAGSFFETVATVAWPTGEIGAMGLEGAVRLGFSKELDAIEEPQERKRRYQQLLDEHYETGKAINGAMKHEFDEVIDPADTRRWIVATIGGHIPDQTVGRYVDAW